MGTTHSDEYKRDAVRVALTNSLTLRKVVADLGVGLSTLRKWIRAISDETELSEQDANLLHENEWFRKENRILREEREVLKYRHGSLPACARWQQPVLSSVA